MHVGFRRVGIYAHQAVIDVYKVAMNGGPTKTSAAIDDQSAAYFTRQQLLGTFTRFAQRNHFG